MPEQAFEWKQSKCILISIEVDEEKKRLIQNWNMNGQMLNNSMMITCYYIKWNKFQAQNRFKFYMNVNMKSKFIWWFGEKKIKICRVFSSNNCVVKLIKNHLCRQFPRSYSKYWILRKNMSNKISWISTIYTYIQEMLGFCEFYVWVWL